MKTLQVFEWLNMPSEVQDELAADSEATGDSYHRWYPKSDNDVPYKAKVNQWLLDNGMQVEGGNEYFHVLIHISW